MRYSDKYRSESIRLPTWNYASTGWYFVTICTQRRIPCLGHIIDEEMHLSPAGTIVAEEWLRTAEVRATVELNAWVIMPNHLHGIIVINAGNEVVPNEDKTPQRGVSTRWKPGTVGSIVNQFKGACTKRIRQEVDPGFNWQARFYEHIIRDEQSLDRIRNYIDSNPARWKTDRLYTDASQRR